MNAKHRCNQDGSQNEPYPVGPLTPASVGPSRTALLASASLIVLAALGAPDAASAGCNDKNQTISSPSTPGPIFSTGGNITIDAGASVAGGPTGVYAQHCGIGVLSNSGAIDGGGGALGVPGGIGVWVASAQTVDLLTNATGATISGGAGGRGPAGATGAAGGVGVSNFGTITTLTNSGAITGGAGGQAGNVRAHASHPGAGGAGGAGLSNAGTLATLTNSGAISGGIGGTGGEGRFNLVIGGTGGAGGAGRHERKRSDDRIAHERRRARRSAGGTGGAGGSAAVGHGQGGAGGAGVSNAGAITTLTNMGKIIGGNGGAFWRRIWEHRRGRRRRGRNREFRRNCDADERRDDQRRRRQRVSTAKRPPALASPTPARSRR